MPDVNPPADLPVVLPIENGPIDDLSCHAPDVKLLQLMPHIEDTFMKDAKKTSDGQHFFWLPRKKVAQYMRSIGVGLTEFASEGIMKQYIQLAHLPKYCRDILIRIYSEERSIQCHLNMTTFFDMAALDTVYYAIWTKDYEGAAALMHAFFVEFQTSGISKDDLVSRLGVYKKRAEFLMPLSGESDLSDRV
ncbi:hypothetical protein HDV00_008829 [Rhizophlyctis rosea]|nr:hypothetical protein HDV00_008829 [Rhizophlyctis rosea]